MVTRDLTRGSTPGPVRLVVLGMPCAFTWEAVAAAMSRNAEDRVYDLRAVFLASQACEVALGLPECAASAPLAGLPVEAVSSRATFVSAAFRDRIAALAPDIIVVACFPWRVPPAIRAIPPLGCLNVHPSLLPDGRGPEPVFWAFRRGLPASGVTIHRMDDGLDTGPILAQEVVDIGPGATIPSLEAELAATGGRILHGVVRDLAHGIVSEREQPSGAWPAAPVPADRDLIATTEWSAQRLARFIRATAPVYGPIPLLVMATGQVLPRPVAAEDVLAADDQAIQADPLAWENDIVCVRCAPGVVAIRSPRQAAPLLLTAAGPCRKP